jgi:putative hydrolase of the HAD superfamily
MQQIKNIIFDLGNVILDIDTNLSKEAFSKQGLKNFEELYTLAAQSEIFDKLEVGAISPEQFYSEFRKITSSNLSNEIIKDCWNELIMDYTQTRIDLLQNLKSQYRTFILSNTNLIHYNFYTELLRQKHKINGLEALVEKAYFSHEIGLKKPNPEIYKFVLKDSSLNASETLFIDDNLTNIEIAKECGLITFWLKEGNLENSNFLK